MKMMINFLSVLSILFAMVSCQGSVNLDKGKLQGENTIDTIAPKSKPVKVVEVLDSAGYRAKILYMLNGDSSGKWFKNGPYPLPGAILPNKRIVAFYGNLYSTRMGILGELPKPQLFVKLQSEIAKWELADPQTPVQPALHYIAVTAQGSPGEDGMYRLRMPFSQIDKVVKMADEINAIVFLDVQVGLSTVQKEIPNFKEYLKRPNIHFGIDPEFSMKTGDKPGSVIGTLDASDINYIIDYLTSLVKENNLPPKVLVVHRFTQGMITNAKLIKKVPEVQVVMHMDGWGHPAQKIDSYKYFICKEPVMFTGFKLFYKNDLKNVPHQMMTPAELVKLKPRPIYIQYQ
jgi:hypothetical protein